MNPLLILACSSSLPPLPPSDAELSASVAAKSVAEGEPVELTVRARQAQGWTVTVAPPSADGLELSLVQQQGPIQVGDATVLTWRYDLTGPAGSYVIMPGAAEVTDPAGEQSQVQASPIFVDIGVQGPTSQLSDFEATPPPAPPAWGLYAALAGGALLLAGAGVGLWLWLQREPEPVRLPDPPHVVARRDWESVRARGLADHPQAVALSQILRAYLEAITGWPATMRTGSEILRWMEAEAVAGATARMRAAHILDATDRLKFAREGGGDAFFEALDDDFDVVVEATRPVGPAASTPAASTPAASTPAASTPAASTPAASTPAGLTPAGPEESP